MYKLIYNIFIVPVMYLVLMFVSVFNRKINRFVKVRKRLFRNLNRQKIRLNPYKKTILFHCSSLGEYKQTLPLIKRFREIPDQYNIVLSFYSPSAGDNIKDVPLVEVMTYLPLDTLYQMKKFVRTLKPDLVIISKHDLWPNFLFELKRNKIPVYLVNALLPEDSLFLNFFVKSFIKPYFSLLDGIVTINEENKQRFKKIIKTKVNLVVSGDSRFDIVKQEACKYKKKLENKLIEVNRRPLVAGSSWSPGEKIIIEGWHKIKYCIADSFLIIVPHEITAEHIYKIEFYCQQHNLSSIVYSDYLDEDSHDLEMYDVLIVDKIGILVEIYSSAYLAYVGGGFGKAGLHSVLEPAAYGLPVLFGPNISRSPEANEMFKLNCGLIFNDVNEFTNQVISLYQDENYYNQVCQATSKYIEENSGATERIYDILSDDLKEVEITVSESFTNAELEKLLSEYNSDKDL